MRLPKITVKPGTRAITLVELVIAIVLLGLIVLGLSSIDLFSRFHIITAERRVKLQNEASVVLEHMSKKIMQAVGNKSDPPIVAYSDKKGIRVRLDTDGNGQADLTDTWIAYRHEDTEIRYYENVSADDNPPGPGGGEVIATHILKTVATDPHEKWGLVIDYLPVSAANQCDITVRARWKADDPTAVVDQENPQVELKASVVMPAVSVN